MFQKIKTFERILYILAFLAAGYIFLLSFFAPKAAPRPPIRQPQTATSSSPLNK